MSPTPSIAPLEAARRVARNTGVQLGGDMLSRIGSLALYLVMARELGEQGFGDFNFAASLAIFVLLAGLGSDQIVTREVSRERNRTQELFWNVNAIKLALGTVAIAAAVGFSFAVGYPGDVRAAVALLSLSSLVAILAKTAQAVFLGIEETRPIAVSLMIRRFSSAAVGIVALLAGAGLVVVSGIYLGGVLLGLAYLGFRLRRPDIKLRRSASLTRARAVAIIALPLGLSLVFGSLLARLDAVLLSLLKDNTAVGIYSAAYRVFEAPLVISAWFALAALPLLSRLGRDTRPTIARAYETGCKVLALSLFPIAAGLVLFASPLIETLYGSEFSAAASALRLLGPSVVLDGIFILSVEVLTAQDRRRPLVPIVGSIAVANAVLNLLLVPTYSWDGAAVAMTLSEVALAVATVMLTVRGTGSVSWLRIGLGPVVGLAAMGVLRLAVGESLPVLGAALLAYVAAALTIERRLFPTDLRFLVESLRSRRVPLDIYG
jgi:O-antigen/teichoic acid export membrane protein